MIKNTPTFTWIGILHRIVLKRLIKKWSYKRNCPSWRFVLMKVPTCWYQVRAVCAPAPHTSLNISITRTSSLDLNSLSLRSSPLSAISQIFSARRFPTLGKFNASWEYIDNKFNLMKKYDSNRVSNHSLIIWLYFKLVLQRKPFAFVLFSCWANAVSYEELILNMRGRAWGSGKRVWLGVGSVVCSTQSKAPTVSFW